MVSFRFYSSRVPNEPYINSSRRRLARQVVLYLGSPHTFNFQPAILKAATDLFPTTKATNFKFLKPEPVVSRPYPDFAQLQIVVSFQTELVVASAVINAVLTKNGWKIYTMHTVAEKLKQFPEVAPNDGHMTGDISWEKQRAKDVDAADPEVLIIGGGQKLVFNSETDISY